MFHFLSACSHRHLSWQLQQFDEERKWQPINRLFLKTYFFAFKEKICLRAPQTGNLWATISIFLLGDELQYQTQGLYQSHSIPGKSHSYTHCICTSGCRMHRGLTETHRSHACHHIFHTVAQWFEMGRVVPLSQDPKEVMGPLNSSGLNTIPTQTVGDRRLSLTPACSQEEQELCF